MTTPIFFNSVPTITMVDPLANILGASSDGVLQYSYSDVVKLAGHSCPSVAGAYLMLLKGLTLLYGDQTPVRGEIRVTIKGNLGEGVVGVIANVASMITGATNTGGFHGLGGKFDRRNLLFFEPEMAEDIGLERLDNGKRIVLSYNPAIVPSDPQMASWLQMILSAKADEQISELFRSAWQNRVKNILIDFAEDPRLIQTRISDQRAVK